MLYLEYNNNSKFHVMGYKALYDLAIACYIGLNGVPSKFIMFTWNLRV